MSEPVEKKNAGTQKRCPVRANKRTPHAPNDAERYILPSGGSFGWYYLKQKSTKLPDKNPMIWLYKL